MMTDDSHKPTRADDDFLVFGAPLIGEEEKREVLDCLETGWLGTGPKVARFEEDFRRYKRAEHAVAVGSCTAAQHLSLLAAGIGPGDEVITTAITFASTVNAIIHAGARPVLADVSSIGFNIDVNDVAARITDRTRAIVPVHFAGRACDMAHLTELVARHDLVLIEDCAHAIETEYHGRPAGTFGAFGCFSFYVTKNVATGEGGMVLTAREEDAARIKTLALHGLSKDAWKRFSDTGYRHYYAVDCGYKNNMMDLQAALGIHQLARVEANWKRRQQIWQRYMEELDDLPLTLPAPPEPDTRHAYHLFTVLIDPQAPLGRDAFLDAMTTENIGVGVHYLSVPVHPYYQSAFGWRPQDWPVANAVGERTVSLPLSAKLNDGDVDDVVCAVRKILSR